MVHRHADKSEPYLVIRCNSACSRAGKPMPLSGLCLLSSGILVELEMLLSCVRNAR